MAIDIQYFQTNVTPKAHNVVYLSPKNGKDCMIKDKRIFIVLLYSKIDVSWKLKEILLPLEVFYIHPLRIVCIHILLLVLM